MVEIIINNNKYSVDKSLTVLQACEQANINIPRFCYHEKLSVAGNCRMCLVEIEKSPKPVASCAMPINPGMVIFTETPLVKKARESVLEFLLINHPLDCPICDQGGECDLQDITLNYGSDRSRFFEFKRGVEDKECGPIVKTIMTRCIHCTRCVRFLTELAGLEVFGALGRGELMEIGTYLNKYLKTELSGNLVDLCPVGALTSKPYAFLARNWELKKFESIDYTDAVGANIVIHTRNNSSTNSFLKTRNLKNDQILRILPKLNNEINECWISDKTRSSFDGLYFNRLNALEYFDKFKGVKKPNLVWNKEFFNTFFMHFNTVKASAEILGNVGTSLSIEELYFFFEFLKNNGSTVLLQNNKLSQIQNDIPLFYQLNTNIKNIEQSDLILLIGFNPRFETSILNLRIRKHFFNKDVIIGYIGPVLDLTYPVTHLGTSAKVVIDLLEGRHTFCKKMRSAKYPIILNGPQIGYRQDAIGLQIGLQFLGKKLYLNLKNFSGLNFVQSSITQINSLDLGIVPNSQNVIYHCLTNKHYLETGLKTWTYFLNSTENSINFAKSSKTTVFCALKTHNSIDSMQASYTIPVNAFFEKDSLSVNIEGKIQKGFKVVTGSALARNSEDFFKSLIKSQNLISTSFSATNKSLYLKNPFLYALNKNRVKFYLNFLNLNLLMQKKIIFTTFKNSIKNFYMTDNTSKNSKIMAECSLFLNNKTNFLN